MYNDFCRIKNKYNISQAAAKLHSNPNDKELCCSIIRIHYAWLNSKLFLL